MQSPVEKKQLNLFKPFPPLPGMIQSSQQWVMSFTAKKETAVKELLYEGTRGVGKTKVLIACFMLYVGKGYGSKWRGVILRDSYHGLEDIIIKTVDMFPDQFGDDCRLLRSKTDYKWVWKTGEELLFRSIENEKDYDTNFHGQEFSFIGWEELTSWKDLKLYFRMMTCLRCSGATPEEMPPLLVRATTNPSGVGRKAVKDYFINAGKPCELITTSKTFAGKTYTSQRTYVKGSFLENPYLAPDYILSLLMLEESDPEKFQQEVLGSWDIASGGVFKDYFRQSTHVIKPFKIPHGWRIVRSYDDGEGHPFSVLWTAESNGIPFKDDFGVERWYPKGSIFVIHELYGAASLSYPNKGVFWNITKIAENILKEDAKVRFNLLQYGVKIEDGPADYNIKSGQKSGNKTKNDYFKDVGINWIEAKKYDGSRLDGLMVMKEMFLAAKNNNDTHPHLYFFNNCPFICNNIPALMPDEFGDVETDGQADHDYDALRYRLVTKKKSTTLITY